MTGTVHGSKKNVLLRISLPQVNWYVNITRCNNTTAKGPSALPNDFSEESLASSADSHISGIRNRLPLFVALADLSRQPNFSSKNRSSAQERRSKYVF